MKKQLIKITLKSNEFGLEIELTNESKPTKEVSAPFICDYDENNNLLGIEIIGFAHYVGPRALSEISKNTCNIENKALISYDNKADGFYLRLMEGKSQKVKAINGRLTINEFGNLISLRIVNNVN